MDHYKESYVSENHYKQTPIIQQPESSQMTYESQYSQCSLLTHDETNMPRYCPPQMFFYNEITNLHLKNQIPSTSAISDSLNTGQTTRGAQYFPQRSDTSSPLPENHETNRSGSKENPLQMQPIDLVFENDVTLYNVIKNGQVSLQVTINSWIKQYKMNRDKALLILIQSFFDAAGCKGVIPPDMFKNLEHTVIIRKMTEKFEDESEIYSYIISSNQWKTFRSNFGDFVSQLIKQCQYPIIYDQYLMDNMVSILIGLSNSRVPAFRHLATLTTMKLMTALVEVALNMSVNLDNTRRHYETELQKAQDKRANDSLESLMAQQQKLKENMNKIKIMLTNLFKSVTAHRYRDILPEIRAICVTEIGVWIKTMHQNFLKDSYLKYIGWGLQDHAVEVRLICLQTLQPLFASKEYKSKLEPFIRQFKDQIVAMTLDIEHMNIAAQAVRLIISILEHHYNILSYEDCVNVYKLVYSKHRDVAHAAGELLNEQFFKLKECTKTVRTNQGKKRLPNTPLIRDLVQFFIESELHEHGAYLVDSLIGSNKMMTDWECMTDLLLEDPSLCETKLDDGQETILIELMVCCIKQAATGEGPIDRQLNRKMSAQEIKQIQDDKQRLTEHFIELLPPLIDKYRANVDKLVYLLSIPQYFDLNMYYTSSQEHNLDLLLQKIHLVTAMNQHSEVLENCAKLLEFLCSKINPMLAVRCNNYKNNLIDTITNKHREIMDDWDNLIEENEIPDNDEICNLVNSIKKISIFYLYHNLGPWNLWDSILKNLKMTYTGLKLLPEEAIKYSIMACFIAIMWKLCNIGNVLENECDNVGEKVAKIKTMLLDLMDVLCDIFAYSTNPLVMKEIYECICVLLSVSCNKLYVKYPVLGNLDNNSNKKIHNILNSFIQKTVFVSEEKDVQDVQDKHSKIKELHKRRNFLLLYCNLILLEIIPVNCAADIFKHFVKYADIIAITIRKARQIDRVICAKTMAISLITSFEELQINPGTLHTSNTLQEFGSLKELAKQFVLSFGFDPFKNREAMTALHRDCISFVASAKKGIAEDEDPLVPPTHVAFLEILVKFTNKLLKEDKQIVLNYLDKNITPPADPSSLSEYWQPWVIYRNSLMHGDEEPEPVTLEQEHTHKKIRKL